MYFLPYSGRKNRAHRGITGIALLFAAVAILSGCASARGFSGRETIYGIVMDGNHKSVSGFRLEYNGGKAAVSSETGMFAFEKVRAGTAKLTGSKPGYFPLQQSVVIIDKRQLLYVTVTSVSEIFDRSDALFAARSWHEAEELLRDTLAQTAKEKEIPIGLLQFYLATSLYKQKKYEETAVLLAGLSGLNAKKIKKTDIEETASVFYFKLMQDMSVGRKIPMEAFDDGA
jgi:hypothetical protein